MPLTTVLMMATASPLGAPTITCAKFLLFAREHQEKLVVTSEINFLNTSNGMTLNLSFTSYIFELGILL